MAIQFEITPEEDIEEMTPEEWAEFQWGSDQWYDFGATMSDLLSDFEHTVTENGDGTYTHEFRFSVLDDPRREVT